MGCGSSTSAGGEVKEQAQEEEAQEQEQEEELLGKGQFFGEEALVGKPYAATVRSERPVSVYFIDQGAFQRLCGNSDAVQKSVAETGTKPATTEGDEEEDRPRQQAVRKRGSISAGSVQVDSNWTPPKFEHNEEDANRLRSFIASTMLLSSLDDSSKETLVFAFQRKSFEKDSEIITQGADGDFYYILEKGRADVYVSKNGGPAEKVLDYEYGGSFGELALLHGEPRQATVKATDDCVCWALDRDTFRKIMMTRGKNHMNERLELVKKVDVLQTLTPYERFQVSEAMQLKEFPAESVITEAGQPAANFYIIRTGTCVRSRPAQPR